MPERYLDLITSQHRQRPRFAAAVEALVKPLCDLEALLQDMRHAFDVDTAVGVQLDAVGVRVGRSRNVRAPLDDVYFSWNVDGLGWGQGIWRGRYDPETGVVSLPDDVYRTLLKAKIAANSWDGTIPSAYEIWAAAFSVEGSVVFIEDSGDMSMIVGISAMPMSAIMQQLLLQQYIPLKPAGVEVEFFAVAVSPGPLFAWNCESSALAGWGSGSWAKKLIPIEGGDYAT